MHEKGGKIHEMPCHHLLEDCLHAYIDGCGLAGDPKGPLFRTSGRGTAQLTGSWRPQSSAHARIHRRAVAAGIETTSGNHTFRATGITAYPKNGGQLKAAAAMGNHASTLHPSRWCRLESHSFDLVEVRVVDAVYQSQNGVKAVSVPLARRQATSP